MSAWCKRFLWSGAIVSVIGYAYALVVLLLYLEGRW